MREPGWEIAEGGRSLELHDFRKKKKKKKTSESWQLDLGNSDFF
jgi:hypothetical protein